MCKSIGEGKDISTMLSAKILSFASLARPIVLMFNLYVTFNQLSGVKSKLAQFIGGISAKTMGLLKWVCFYSYHSPSLNSLGNEDWLCSLEAEDSDFILTATRNHCNDLGWVDDSLMPDREEGALPSWGSIGLEPGILTKSSDILGGERFQNKTRSWSSLICTSVQLTHCEKWITITMNYK